MVNVKTGKVLSQEIDGQSYNTFATNANARLTWANASNKGYSVEPNFDVNGSFNPDTLRLNFNELIGTSFPAACDLIKERDL